MRTGIVLALSAALGAATVVDPQALVEAAKNSDHAALRSLLKPGANVNAAQGDGATALHWASYRDDLESADLLIRAGANVNAANDLGVTPLWTATQNGSATMVRRLLDAGADPNAKLPSGETLVMTAARAGKAEVLELLLNKGADVNAKATRGQTALMWAVAQQHPDAVKVLLAHGADVKARSEEYTQVWQTAPNQDVYPGYKAEIRHGGDTAMLFAARAGDLASAKLLVAAGANVNDEAAYGVSATVLAAHGGNTELVQFLLDKDANPNAGKAGYTALPTPSSRRRLQLAAIRRTSTSIQPLSGPRRSGWPRASVNRKSCACLPVTEPIRSLFTTSISSAAAIRPPATRARLRAPPPR
jgi:ankyrin repeat protein